jgi:hypothetical protein
MLMPPVYSDPFFFDIQILIRLGLLAEASIPVCFQVIADIETRRQILVRAAAAIDTQRQMLFRAVEVIKTQR